MTPLIDIVFQLLIFFLVTAQMAEVTRAQLEDARRERDALRVAYEAQQLRLKELSDRLSTLEDRVVAHPARAPRDLSALPVVRLSRRPSSPGERASPPSAQAMRAARLARQWRGAEGGGDEAGELPALTADNISDFTPITRREREAYLAPQG